MQTPKQIEEIKRRKQQGIGWHGKQNQLVVRAHELKAVRDMNAVAAERRDRIKKHIG